MPAEEDGAPRRAVPLAPERAAEGGDGAAERWSGAAEEWSRHAERIDDEAAPVTAWLLDATSPAPGETVLEVGAGPGGVGLRAAEAVLPGGRVVITDIAPAMVDVARRRAQELGLDAVHVEVADAAALPLPDAAADAVVCRFALQAMPDPAVALGEMLRVLRPGGRLALAVWGPSDLNPGTAAAMATIREAASQPPEPSAAPIFSLADDTRLRSLFDDAGFVDVRIEHVTGERRYEDFESWWELRRRLPPGAQGTWESLSDEKRADLEARLRERVAPHRRGDEIVFPWDVLAASGRRPEG